MWTHPFRPGRWTYGNMSWEIVHLLSPSIWWRPVRRISMAKDRLWNTERHSVWIRENPSRSPLECWKRNFARCRREWGYCTKTTFYFWNGHVSCFTTDASICMIKTTTTLRTRTTVSIALQTTSSASKRRLGNVREMLWCIIVLRFNSYSLTIFQRRRVVHEVRHTCHTMRPSDLIFACFLSLQLMDLLREEGKIVPIIIIAVIVRTA